MSVHVFGIRHHGPGCARSLRWALEALEPDVVLVEGPPDAEEVLPLLSEAAMIPPVALLVYPPEAPQRAVFYPFAEFSPEWQALRYAFQRGIPARFMDLPQRHRLAMEDAEEENRKAAAESSPEAAAPEAEPSAKAEAEPAPAAAPPGPGDGEPALEDDPLGTLAMAAGYTDRELWWEHQIEQRQDPRGLFEGILEAMIALRCLDRPARQFEAHREAWMRRTVRAAQKEEFARIAVVCGAWHAPALVNMPAAKDDDALLAGLPKTKVVTTWIPWTYSRLSYRSGYGAGVVAPGWYHHLWTSPGRVAARWAAHAARLLRGADLDASSASVIETVRLAEALAALRNLPMPGLAELTEAIQAVLCQGEPAPMRLIRDKLEIGDRLGRVPEATPAVPLQRDLEAQQRRLRLKPTTEIKTLDLDLRNETDRARSRLLHQLHLLGIDWGQRHQAPGSAAGTFHEVWQLQWQVEFAVSLVEANVWGNTVESAAAAKVKSQADEAKDLPPLTDLLDGAILAGLGEAMAHVLARLQSHAAVAADVRHLMDALAPLARVARYGDVRGTPTGHVLPVIEGLFQRVLVGLPGACASLDDEAAHRMVESIGRVQESLDLLDRANDRQAWQQVLRQLVDRDAIHGLVRGWSCRLLYQQKALDEGELARRARLALAPAAGTLPAAAWVEGLLCGSGMVLLHEDALWMALDAWLCDLSPETFVELLPLLRRAFSTFTPPERRAMGEKVKRLDRTAQGKVKTSFESPPSIDARRAEWVLPVLRQVLGAVEDSLTTPPSV
jgi:hypothetical protein